MASDYDYDYRVEFEKLVSSTLGDQLQPPCGKANCLMRDSFGIYWDRYMEGAFHGFIMARKAAQVSPKGGF